MIPNQPTDKNINVALTTLIVTYIMKKLQLDNIYYGMFYGLISQLLVMDNIQSIKLYMNLQWHNIYDYLIYIPLFLFICIVIYYTKGNIINYIKQYYQCDYMLINIYDDKKIKYFIDYIKIKHQYYDSIVDTDIGNLDALIQKIKNPVLEINLNDVTPIENYQIHFNDLFLGVKGYYIWKKVKKDTKNNDGTIVNEFTINYIQLCILKPTVLNPDTLMNKISDFVNSQRLNNITLACTKVFANGKNHVVTFYEGQRQPIEILEEKLIKPFFHQDRDRLWSVIKNTCLHPEFYSSRGQVARISLLLYGPPGSGKSTLAYRIAMCLYRNIVSLDLRNLERSRLYQILQRPAVAGGNNYKDALFLFEEFDISVKQLYYREQKLLHGMDDYFTKMSSLLNNNDKNTKIDDIRKAANNPNEFMLRDLLEIFQGPIPIESMIMMATTNKYDEIKEMCPELFRPGRLTPICFGYIDRDTLQEISMYFFSEKIKGYIPDVLKIPTSQIIELAFESLTFSKAPHDYFNDKIIKLIA